MNTFSPALVRLAFLVIVSAWTAPCTAQETDGLTSDFDKLSPKERSKIAAKETREAAADSGYQVLMQRADVAFRAGRYEDALSIFEKARVLRPYNVYPKVKIQDLQALIKRRDRELSEQKSKAAPPAAPVEVAAPAPPVTPMTAPPPSAPGPPKAASEQPIPPASTEGRGDPAPEKASPPSFSSFGTARPAPPPEVEAEPATLGERIYMEAGATVIERTVEDEGRPVVYKKVVHPWGRTFYFKDGLAISEQAWNNRFNP